MEDKPKITLLRVLKSNHINRLLKYGSCCGCRFHNEKFVQCKNNSCIGTLSLIYKLDNGKYYRE